MVGQPCVWHAAGFASSCPHTTRHRKRLVALLSVLVQFMPIPVAAHAYVVETSPAINEIVTASTRNVFVSFDEPVTVESARPLVVQGEDGMTYPCVGGAGVDPDDATLVVCKLIAPLPRGAYTVRWRVTSADTHVVHGVFSFGVDVAANAPSRERASPYDPSSALVALIHWLVMVGVVTVVGAIIFETTVLRMSGYPNKLESSVRSFHRVAGTLRSWGTLMALLASFLALDIQGAAVTGTDLLRAAPALPKIAFGSTWGFAWLARSCLLILLFALGPRPSVLVFASGAVLLLTLSVSGHAITTGLSLQSVLSVVSDWLHVAAVATWSGGLFVLTVGLRPALASADTEERNALVQIMITRFSSLAIVAVALIAITGSYSSIIGIVTLQSLTGTTYGRLVLGKIAFFAVLLVFGYYHFRQGRERHVHSSFARSVSYEAAILLTVLAISAFLTGIAPPNHGQGGG